MLCPLSALDPNQGPKTLIDEPDLKDVASEMALEILSYDVCSLDFDELTSILSSALSLTLSPPEGGLTDNPVHKLPDGIFKWEDDGVLGIAYWDRDQILDLDPLMVNDRCRSGLGVETRLLGGHDGYGYFYSIIVGGEDGEEKGWVDRFTCCSDNRGWPFFVLRTCFQYLSVWLDPHLPPRIAFKDSAPTMSLEGELYEILNTRNEEREYSDYYVYN